MLLKQQRNRYFSFIFVPDQDQNPKSFSMSYTKGYLILLLLGALAIHAITGLVSYFRISHLDTKIQSLETENESLVAENKQIENIAREFQKLSTTDDKIKSALVASLGLDDESLKELETIAADDAASLYNGNAVMSGTPGVLLSNSSRVLLIPKKKDGFFNPENLPTFLPVQGHVTTRFQQGGWFMEMGHLGIDIAAKRGTVIKAAGAGTVLLADYTADFGNAVVISHGNDLFTYYGHAMHLLVKRGMVVNRGQQIALLGSSGPSSAPHLHFEIWKNGKALDPEKCIFELNENINDAGLW
jgi:murein DD-endopeptidase MepM/ murein hydrolase activator NlpD